MSNVVQNPHQDWFFGDPHLSLLPRTIRASSKSAISANQESESILSFFRSMELNSSSELLEQANTILNSSSELPNFKPPHHLPSKDMDRNPETNAVDCPQKRRPGLGRKRARFSLKPSTSQPFSNVDPSLNTAELQNPEEFFAAFEKHENAEKELKRLRGHVSTDLSQPHQPMLTRPRRPGILGKTVSYRHHYPSLLENVETLLPSQEEKFEEGIPRLSKATPNMMSNTEATDQPSTTLEREKDDGELVPVTQEKGSVAKTVNRVGDLLDGLLSSYKDLDKSEMVTLLQEELQIKPIEVNKLSLPDMNSVPRNYLKAQEHLSKPRKALKDLQHMMNTMANGNTPVAKQVVKSFEGPLISPTPPRNPFASISMLQNDNLQIDPLRDAALLEPPVDISSVEIDGRRLSFNRNFQSPMYGVDNNVDDNINSGKLVTEDSACSFSLPTDENSSRPDGDMDVKSNGFEDKLGNKVKDLLREPLTSGASQLCISDEEIDGNKLSSNGKSQSLLHVGDSNFNSGKLVTEDSVCAFGIPINCNPSRSYNDMDGRSNEFGDSLEDKGKNLVQETSTSMETMDRGQLDKSNSAAETNLPVDGNSDSMTRITEQHNEDSQVPPISLLTKPSKTREPSHRQKKQKEQPRGSLAGAGTLWKSGIRRSTRIKSRPLEYWRGERFLYGRIHDSLATVIGVKCSSSPSNSGEEPVLKVKSFVSEEYKELVEKAALY